MNGDPSVVKPKSPHSMLTCMKVEEVDSQIRSSFITWNKSVLRGVCK